MIRKVLSIYMTLYLLAAGMLPAASAWGQARTEKKKYILAVMNLDAKGVSQVESEVLSEKLRSHILRVVETPKYRSMKNSVPYELVERTQMDKIFDQFNIQNTGCVSDSCAVELGKMLGTDRIIIGQVGLVGKTYSVSARIVDIETSKAVRTADRQYRGSIDDLINKVIIDIGNDLLMIKAKKSHKMLYFLAGVAIAGAGAGAALMGTGKEKKTTVNPPSNFSLANVSDNGVTLTWTDNSDDELGFIIEQKVGDTVFTEIARTNPNTNVYIVTNLEPDTQYSFRIRSFTVEGYSAPTDEISIKTLLPLPPDHP